MITPEQHAFAERTALFDLETKRMELADLQHSAKIRNAVGAGVSAVFLAAVPLMWLLGWFPWVLLCVPFLLWGWHGIDREPLRHEIERAKRQIRGQEFQCREYAHKRANGEMG